MSKAEKFILAVALLICPWSLRPAHAQGGVNGSINGWVLDQTGSPIKGVKVSATSDTQIGGAKVAYTNDEGFFRIVGLLPGVFEVAASAPKLKTAVQKDLRVGLNAPAQVDLVMEVETGTVEEVKVAAKAPTVSVTTANLKEDFDAEFIDNLPVAAKINTDSALATATAGGTGRPGNIRYRGGGTNQNAFNVEGFNITGTQLTVGSLAAIEVQTAGAGAENAGVPGGVVNMVSKSGSNKFQFDLQGYAEHSKLSFFKDATDAEAPSHSFWVNPAFSGPIVKDRLWFYVNFDARSSVTYRERDLTGLSLLGDQPPSGQIVIRGSTKLTWQITARNKLSSYTSVRFRNHKNQGNATRDERDAFNMTQEQDVFTGLIWESLLSENLYLRSQAGVQQQWDDVGPERCRTDPENCDHIRQIRNAFPIAQRLNNYDLHRQEILRTVEVINQLEWFASSKALGEHTLRAKSRVFAQIWEDAQSTPGDGYYQYLGGTPDRERVYFANDPRLSPATYGWRIRGTSAMTTTHSLTDSVRIARYLTLNPGVAYTTSQAANTGAGTDLDGGAFTPHISAAWDATQDGRTVVRASFNNYVDTDALRVARHSLGERVFRECTWNETSQQFDNVCTFGGGASNSTFGLPCGPSGNDANGAPCRERVAIPRTWEYTFGAERELIQGLAMGTDLIYRQFTYPYETRETNRIWDKSGLLLDPTGGYRNGRGEEINDLGTPANARRNYLGVSTSVRKREGRLKLVASYTWATLQGNVNNNETNDFGTNPVRDRYFSYGALPDDYRHEIKGSVVWQAARPLSLGYILRYRSGGPYERRFRNDVEGAVTDRRASAGINPGSNVNDPGDDRPLRLPDLIEMALQVRTNLQPLLGIKLEAYVDVLNLLALRTTTDVVTDDGPAWGSTTGRLEPMRMRLGFRFSY